MLGQICAIVVTHNRRQLLRESLEALRLQTRRPDHILVVDNASTDGTQEMLRAEFPEVEVLHLDQNEGGAGGFHEGIKLGYSKGFDWLWLMDDDTIPQREALAELERAGVALADEHPLILASRVEWTDGSLHPMNVPSPNISNPSLLFRAVERGYFPIRSASFVSLLLHREAVAKYGLPFKDYFVWNDDVEYTARVLKHETGFAVPKSVAIHKTKQKYVPHDARPERFYYEVRNKLWMLRHSRALFPKEKARVLFYLIVGIGRYAYRQGSHPYALGQVLRGLKDGLLKKPKG